LVWDGGGWCGMEEGCVNERDCPDMLHFITLVDVVAKCLAELLI
jgi:hypothetical protein